VFSRVREVVNIANNELPDKARVFDVIRKEEINSG